MLKQFINQTAVAILRQTYVNNVSSFAITSYVAGYLRSLDPETASANGMQYGYGYSFITDFNVDIRVGDKIAIALSGTTTTYTVKGVNQNAQLGNPTAYLKALVTLPE